MGSPDGAVDGLIVFNTGITDEDVILPANPRFIGPKSTEPNSSDLDGNDPTSSVPEGAVAGTPRPYMLRMTTESPIHTDDGEPTFALSRSQPLVEPGAAVRACANTVQIFRNDLTGT
ncbi:hypothetical protein [Arthrobacter alpinus]|nr:hypothetical protein [Arthrobacter alpinus]